MCKIIIILLTFLNITVIISIGGKFMEREIIKKLIEWKNSKKRKPLIVQGARQVGKTYIIKEFCL